MTGRPIIIASMGQCGNSVATAFLDQLLSECGVGLNGEPPADQALAEALTVFCDRQSDGRLVPRRLLVCNSDIILSSGTYTHLAPKETKISNDEDNHNNWAMGYKGIGYKGETGTLENFVQLARDKINAMNGDCIIWLFHALGGGYGSGAGSRFLEMMFEEYGDTVPIVSISVAPSPKVSDTVPEPYNAIFTLDRLIKKADQVLLFDNEALYEEAYRRMPTPKYSDLNAIISSTLCTLVSPLLWPDAAGQRMSADALHASLAPTRSGTVWKWGSADARPISNTERFVALTKCYEAASPSESDTALGERLIKGEHSLLSATAPGSWTSMFAILHRGPGNEAGFAQAIPEGHTRLALESRSKPKRAIAAGGHTALAATLKRISEQFTVIYRRKAFLHWYTNEGGMDEFEIEEPYRVVESAIDEMTPHAEVTPDD